MTTTDVVRDATAQSIDEYGLLGDLHTAALLGSNGSIDWLCLPRFDSAACFAALLGDARHGYWRIAPTSGGTSSRHYRGRSLTVQTDWETSDGSLRVIDFMPPRDDAANVVRIVEGVSGDVEVDMSLRIRFDYGHMMPWIRYFGDYAQTVAGPHGIRVDASTRLEGDNECTYSRFRLGAGDAATFVLTYQPSHHTPAEPVDPYQSLADTDSFWSQWDRQTSVSSPWKDAVGRSLLTLKALTYEPTGGLVAAATTSLPQKLHGGLNRDFRNCRLRDASTAIRGFLCTGRVGEAQDWRDWLLRAAAGDPHRLQMTYGIDGARRLTEYDVDWLPGYRELAPVTVGYDNPEAPALDVRGEILDTLHRCRESGIEEDENAWRLQRFVVRHIVDHWTEPDIGPLEETGDLRQFVYSKVMAWVAVDRAVQAVERFGMDGPVETWRRVRDEIHASVCSEGYHDDRGTFTRFYGSEELDAWLLLIPRTGFLPYDDPRVVRTVEAVEQDLMQNGLLLPFVPAAEDEYGARDRAMLLECSFWLVEALAGIGSTDRAKARFENLLRLSNDLGLFTEQYDPSDQLAMGNVPHGHAHADLINAAYALREPGEENAAT